MHRRAVDQGCLGFKVDDHAIGLNDGLGVTFGAAAEGVNAPPIHPCEMAWWAIASAETETLDLVLDTRKSGKD